MLLHNRNYVVFFRLDHQPQPLDLLPMFCSGGHDIDSRRVDTAMPQDVCQLCNILLNAVKGPCKQFAQVMGKDLAGFYCGRLTERLHLRPDITPIQRLSASRHKDRPCSDTASPGIFQQQPAQLSRQEDGTDLAFAAHCDLPSFYGFHCKKAQFRHANAGAANGFQHHL